MRLAMTHRPDEACRSACARRVLRSAAARARIFSATRIGARVAVAGMKLGPWWAAPLNPLVRRRARPYMTSFDGLGRPWRLLERHFAGFDRESRNFGSGYIGWGRT